MNRVRGMATVRADRNLIDRRQGEAERISWRIVVVVNDLEARQVEHRGPEHQALHLAYLVLLSLWLQQERIPKSAETASKQIKPGSPIELVPIGEQCFAMLQFCFPFLLPIGTQTSWNDHANQCD